MKEVLPSKEGSWEEQAQRVADGIRRRVLEHVMAHNGGYLSQACSAAEILATLYVRVMNIGPSEAPLVPPPFTGVPGLNNLDYRTGAAYNGPRAPHLDRFVFSPSHYALALYATLVETGRMDPAGLQAFNVDGSTVEMIGAEHSPGMETTTGSLAQALSQAGGIALARRLRQDQGRVWVFMSDGEFQEGQTWEALAALTHHRLDNVGMYVDVNGQQCDGEICSVLGTDPLSEKLRSFGIRVFEVDGHDVNALAMPAGQTPAEQPLAVLAVTDPCRGVDPMRTRAPRLHYLRFSDEKERLPYLELLERMRK